MEPAPATSASGTMPADAGPLRQLLREHRFPEALAAAQALLAQAPAERDALLCAAIAQRFLGRIPAALSTLATLEAQHPRFSRLYEERGRCFVEQRQAQPAIEAFLKAVNLNHALLAAVVQRAPEYRAARQEYAFVLVEMHRYQEARRELELLLQAEPESAALKTLYAASCVGLGEHERAIGLYRELLVGAPADAEAHLSIGHALKTLGQAEAAVASYHRAAECRPDFGDAYWSLANLKTYRFTDAELTQLHAALAAPATPLADRYHL